LLTAGHILVYNFAILTEGVFATLLILHFCAVCLSFRSKSPLAFVLVGASIGLGAALRPAGLFMIGGFLPLALIWGRPALRLAGLAALSCVTILAAVHIAGFLTDRLTDWTQGRQWLAVNPTFTHVVHLYRSERTSAAPRLARAIENAVSEYRLRRAEARSWSDAHSVEEDLHNSVSRRISIAITPECTNYHPEACPVPDERILAMLAMETIFQNPLGYLEAVAINIFAGYSKYVLLGRDPKQFEGGYSLRFWFTQSLPLAASQAARRHIQPVLVGQAELVSLLRSETPLPVSILARKGFQRQLILALFGASAFLLGLISLYRPLRSRSALLGFYAAVLHLGGVTFVALTTSVIPRYLVPLDVCAIVTLGCALDTVFQLIIGQCTPRQSWHPEGDA